LFSGKAEVSSGIPLPGNPSFGVVHVSNNILSGWLWFFLSQGLLCEIEDIRRVAGGFFDFHLERTKGNGQSMNWGALSAVCSKMVIAIYQGSKKLLLILWA
jgi:hypothetical protein